MDLFLNVVPIMIVVGLILIFIVLIIVLISMLSKGDFNKKYSNKLMRLRVLIQGIIILIFSIILIVNFLK